MKKDKYTDKQVVSIVVQSFFRLTKDKGIYHLVMSRFNETMNPNKKNDFVDLFGRFKGISNFIEKYTQFCVNDFKSRRHNDEKYDFITLAINHLIHFFLEGAINGMDLGLYGQKIFDMACGILYGDDYKKDMDDLAQKHQVPTPKNPKEAFLIGQYMHCIQEGQFNGTFEQFRKSTVDNISPCFEELLRNANTLNEQNEVDDEWDEEADDNETYAFNNTFENTNSVMEGLRRLFESVRSNRR